jgi:hypothetical protein
MPIIRTTVSVLFNDRTLSGSASHWAVDVEDTAPDCAFRRYQLPTRYRTRASALRAARALAESMGATLDTRDPWC